jgi:hypothetical protein
MTTLNSIFTYNKILYLGSIEGYAEFFEKYHHHKRIGDEKVCFTYLLDETWPEVWDLLSNTVIICEDTYALSPALNYCINNTSDDNIFIFENQFDVDWYFPDKNIKIRTRFEILDL